MPNDYPVPALKRLGVFFMPRRPVALAIVLSFLGMVRCLVAADALPGLAGRFDLTVHATGGDHPAWLEVTKSGRNTLVGRFVGQFGSARPIAKIEATTDTGTERFRFAIPPQWEDRSTDLVVEGRFTDGVLEGTITDAAGNPIPFEGRRAPLLDHAEPAWGKSVDLFNGRDLAGWTPQHGAVANGWRVKDGILVNAEPGNNLRTERTFDDFKLRAEFRYPKGSNGGIYLRGRYEVQIEDNFGGEADSHRIGGVYGFLTPCLNAAKPAGEWQEIEITLVGRRVTVVLNGEQIIDRQLIPGITGGAIESDEGAPGPILLQGDHGPIEFRRLTLTPDR